MSKQKKKPYDICLAMLEKKPDVTFAQVKKAVEKTGQHIFPVSYGRAKLQLGLVSAGAGKAGRKPKTPLERAMRKLAMPVAHTPKDVTADIASVVQIVKDSEADRQRMRRTLEKIQAMLNEVLAA